MVSLKFYNFTHFPQLNYSLDEIQKQFTAEVPFALQRIASRNLTGDFQSKPITIFNGETAVGFFVLDFGVDKVELTANPNSVLLRSLSLNPNFQGKGIGKAAMNLIPKFIRKYFPATAEIVLAVNENNLSAFNLYLKCGYRFGGKTRMGRSGMQLVMYRYV